MDVVVVTPASDRDLAMGLLERLPAKRAGPSGAPPKRRSDERADSLDADNSPNVQPWKMLQCGSF